MNDSLEGSLRLKELSKPSMVKEVNFHKLTSLPSQHLDSENTLGLPLTWNLSVRLGILTYSYTLHTQEQDCKTIETNTYETYESRNFEASNICMVCFTCTYFGIAQIVYSTDVVSAFEERNERMRAHVPRPTRNQNLSHFQFEKHSSQAVPDPLKQKHRSFSSFSK